MANRWTKPAEAEKAPAAVAEAAPVAEPPAQPGLSGEGKIAERPAGTEGAEPAVQPLTTSPVQRVGYLYDFAARCAHEVCLLLAA